MAEYIEREAAIAAIKKDIMGGLNYESILKRIPSEDVQSVKHGVWMYCSIDDMFHCTVCDAAAVRNSFVYCPICGARMDGEENV